VYTDEHEDSRRTKRLKQREREKKREGKKEMDRKSLGAGLWKKAAVGGAGTFASAQGLSTLVFTRVSRHIS